MRTKLYITPNLVSCNILLKGLVGVDDLDAALTVLDAGGLPQMSSRIPQFSLPTAAKGILKVHRSSLIYYWPVGVGRMMYTMLIGGYCMRRKLQDAARFMDEMEAAGVQPNEVTYSVVVWACCKEGKSVEARDLMREMLDAGYVLDTPLCAKVVDVHYAMMERHGRRMRCGDEW